MRGSRGFWFSLKIKNKNLCWVDGPRRHRCAKMRSLQISTREPSVEKIIRIAIDTSKSVYQLHGVNEAEQPVRRQKMKRDQMIAFFKALPATIVGIEACGASHHWARVL